MFVNYVCRDDRKELSQTQEFESLSWEQVEEAIRNLDGERYSYLMMSPSDQDASEYCFGIRAAEMGIYICNFYDGDEYYLINPEGKDLSKVLQIGEFEFYSETEFTGIEDTIKAARTYFESGIMEPSLTWEKL